MYNLYYKLRITLTANKRREAAVINIEKHFKCISGDFGQIVFQCEYFLTVIIFPLFYLHSTMKYEHNWL